MKYRTKPGIEAEITKTSAPLMTVMIKTGPQAMVMFGLHENEVNLLFEPADTPRETVEVKREDLKVVLDTYLIPLPFGGKNHAPVVALRSALGVPEECKHDGICLSVQGNNNDAGGAASYVGCCKCGMVRERGWTSDWHKPTEAK